MLKVKEGVMGVSQKGFGAIETALVVVAVGIIGFAGWYVYDSDKKTNSIYDKSVDAGKLAKNQKAANQKIKASDAQSTPVTEALIAQISGAVSDQKYSDLEGVLKDEVTVVIAATEKGGPEDKTSAIKDLDYLKSATAPWDFNLSAGTLQSYAEGSYKQYFTDNTIFGKSADGMVVAFGIDDNGVIESIFIASNADLLTQ